MSEGAPCLDPQVCELGGHERFRLDPTGDWFAEAEAAPPVGFGSRDLRADGFDVELGAGLDSFIRWYPGLGLEAPGSGESIQKDLHSLQKSLQMEPSDNARLCLAAFT